MRKLAAYVAPVLMLIGLLGFVSTVKADEKHTFRGVVSNLDTMSKTFTLVTPHSGNIKVTVDSGTQYWDDDNDVRHFSDLSNGEEIKIKGDFSDTTKIVDNVYQVRFDD